LFILCHLQKLKAEEFIVRFWRLWRWLKLLGIIKRQQQRQEQKVSGLKLHDSTSSLCCNESQVHHTCISLRGIIMPSNTSLLIIFGAMLALFCFFFYIFSYVGKITYLALSRVVWNWSLEADRAERSYQSHCSYNRTCLW